MHTVTHTGAAPEAAKHHHAAVIRMDHRSARLLYLEEDACIDGGNFEVDWEGHSFRQTPTDARHGSGRTHPDTGALFAAVAQAIARAEHVALAGPGSAKREFVQWLREHHHEIADRIEAVEDLDRVTDGELAAAGRRMLHAPAGRRIWPRNQRG
jgi:stalled ribosome rescue protein Dom34